jgi:hypothetical protein
MERGGAAAAAAAASETGRRRRFISSTTRAVREGVGESDTSITVVDDSRVDTVDEAGGVDRRESARAGAGRARRRRRREARRVIWKI